jgi:hypothetical protein
VTTQTTDKEKGNGFWRVALIVLGIITLVTVISDLMESKGDDTLIGIFMLPLFPGFIIYTLVTGDIHGWQPGPIGQWGRILVTALGSWLFWTPLVYWIYKRIKK